MRECSGLLHNVVLQENISDEWRWLLDPSHGYSVRGAYRFLTNSGDVVDRTLVDDIWHRQIPSKVSLLVWRLFRDRLPTKDNLVRRRVLHIDGAACVSGCGHLETSSHLFVTCNFFGSLWYLVWSWLGIDFVPSSDLRQHFVQFSKMAGLPRSTQLYFRIIWFASVWVLWKERNDHVFQNTASDLSTLMAKVKLNSYLWLKSKEGLFSYIYYDWWNHPLLCNGCPLLLVFLCFVYFFWVVLPC